ncbi:MAG: sugar phosphate isomerase/epimerase family protein [Terriglobia bacterium]
MGILSRREFLSTSVLFGVAVPGFSKSSSGREPHIPFPNAPRKRLSVTTWPFRKYIESPANHYRDPQLPGIELKDFAAMVAKKFNIYNINPLSQDFSSTAPGSLDEFRKSIEKTGSHMVGLGLHGGAFYDPDARKRRAAVAATKKWIDIAAIVGSPSVKPQIDESHRLTPNVDRCAQSYGALAEYGARKNIVINMENDDPVTQDPFFIAKVIEKVGNPYLRSLPDFGNDAVKGPGFNERALQTMFHHAYNMSHVKGAVNNRRHQVCTVNVPQIFGIAKSSGYRGYFSMEYDTDFGDPFSGTHVLIRESLKYLA